MNKKLSEMTLEELWQLFPIVLSEYSPEWQIWYNDEYKLLQSILPQDKTLRISHIGSTALGSIAAKPTVDILVEMTDPMARQELKNRLINGGWTCMSEEKNRDSFNKGYTAQGYADRVFHLHLRDPGDNCELCFRDYLREHIDIAYDYEAIKRQLARQFEFNRDAYTNAKADFVNKYTKIAIPLYGNRYATNEQPTNLVKEPFL